MGCFEQACVVSRLPISYRNPCVVIPVISNQSGFSDGPFSTYRPLCLPIEGTYNDYGSMENVVENEHTKYLEEYFGLPIQTIVHCICDTRKSSEVEYTEFGSLLGAFETNCSEISKTSLIKLGFEVAQTGEITHSEIEHAIRVNNGEEALKDAEDAEPKKSQSELWAGIEPNVSYRLVKNKEKYPKYIVEEQRQTTTHTLKSIREVCARVNLRLRELKTHWGVDETRDFIFGIPKDPQTQYRLFQLHRARPAFVKKEIYDGFLAIAKEEHLKAHQYYQDYLKEAIGFYRELREVLNGTPSEKPNSLRALLILGYKNNALLQPFGTTDQETTLYLEPNLPAKYDFLDQFIEFWHFSQSLYTMNVRMAPGRALMQFGDREVQQTYFQLINRILQDEIDQLEKDE